MRLTVCKTLSLKVCQVLLQENLWKWFFSEKGLILTERKKIVNCKSAKILL